MKLAATNASSPQSGKFKAKVTTRNTTPSPTNAHVAWKALSILPRGDGSSPGSRSGGMSRIGRTMTLTSRQTTGAERHTNPNSWRDTELGSLYCKNVHRLGISVKLRSRLSIANEPPRNSAIPTQPSRSRQPTTLSATCFPGSRPVAGSQCFRLFRSRVFVGRGHSGNGYQCDGSRLERAARTNGSDMHQEVLQRLGASVDRNAMTAGVIVDVSSRKILLHAGGAHGGHHVAIVETEGADHVCRRVARAAQYGDFLALAAEPGGQSGQFAPQRRRVARQQPQ